MALLIGRLDRLQFVTYIYSSESVRCALALVPFALACERKPRGWSLERDLSLSRPSHRNINSLVTALKTCLAGAQLLCTRCNLPVSMCRITPLHCVVALLSE